MRWRCRSTQRDRGHRSCCQRTSRSGRCWIVHAPQSQSDDRDATLSDTRRIHGLSYLSMMALRFAAADHLLIEQLLRSFEKRGLSFRQQPFHALILLIDDTAHFAVDFAGGLLRVVAFLLRRLDLHHEWAGVHDRA